MKRLFLTIIAAGLAFTGVVAQEHKGKALKDRIVVGGYAQFGTNYVKTEGHESSAMVIRKVELLAKGQITDKWTFGFTGQFHNQFLIKDLFMQYEIAKAFRVRVGQFKTPFTMENNIAPFFSDFITGCSAPGTYFIGVAGDPLCSGTAGRDMGIELNGDLAGDMINYRLMVMNGNGINASDDNMPKVFGGSLAITPLSGVKLHSSFIAGRQKALGAITGIAIGDEYNRTRISVGAQLEAGRFSLLGEYMYGKDDERGGRGLYAIGKANLFKGFDVIAGYDRLIRDTAVSDAVQESLYAGVQYWFYKNCRFQLQYNYISPEEAAGVHSVMTQLQLVF